MTVNKKNKNLGNTSFTKRKELEEKIYNSLVRFRESPANLNRMLEAFDLGMKYSQILQFENSSQEWPDFLKNFKSAFDLVHKKNEVYDPIKNLLISIFQFAVGKQLEAHGTWLLVPNLLWSPERDLPYVTDFSPDISSATGIESHAFGFDEHGDFIWHISLTPGGEYPMDVGRFKGELLSFDIVVNFSNPNNNSLLELSNYAWPTLTEGDWSFDYSFSSFPTTESDLVSITSIIQQFWVQCFLSFNNEI